MLDIVEAKNILCLIREFCGVYIHWNINLLLKKWNVVKMIDCAACFSRGVKTASMKDHTVKQDKRARFCGNLNRTSLDIVGRWKSLRLMRCGQHKGGPVFKREIVYAKQGIDG